MKAPALATNKRNKATSIIILSLLQWEDHIDFGKNFGQRWPLINRSDKKNDDCGICAAPHQRFSSALGYSLHGSYLPSFANDAAETSLAPVGRGSLVSGIRHLHAVPRWCGAGRSLKPRDYYYGFAQFVFSFRSVLLRISRQFLRR